PPSPTFASGSPPPHRRPRESPIPSSHLPLLLLGTETAEHHLLEAGLLVTEFRLWPGSWQLKGWNEGFRPAPDGCSRASAFHSNVDRRPGTAARASRQSQARTHPCCVWGLRPLNITCLKLGVWLRSFDCRRAHGNLRGGTRASDLHPVGAAGLQPSIRTATVW